MSNNFDDFSNFTYDFEQFIENISKIDWFKNCGTNYNVKLYYNFVLDNNIEIVRKNLNRENNYKGIITVENLFQEGAHRIYSYFKNNNKINMSVENIEKNSWKNLMDKTIVEIKKKEIVLKTINEKLFLKLEINKPINTFVFNLLKYTMMEIYCKKYFFEIPEFFEKIFKIYEDGHLITGWKGKFPSPYLFVEKLIDNKKGELIIW